MNGLNNRLMYERVLRINKCAAARSLQYPNATLAQEIGRKWRFFFEGEKGQSHFSSCMVLLLPENVLNLAEIARP